MAEEATVDPVLSQQFFPKGCKAQMPPNRVLGPEAAASSSVVSSSVTNPTITTLMKGSYGVERSGTATELLLMALEVNMNKQELQAKPER